MTQGSPHQFAKKIRVPRALRCRRHRTVCSRAPCQYSAPTNMFVRHVLRNCQMLPSGLTTRFIENKHSDLFRNPVQLPKQIQTNHTLLGINAHLPADLLSALPALPQHNLQTHEREFTTSMLCCTTPLLTHCKWQTATPTNQIREVKINNKITRRRQPRKNSTSEIIEGYLVCWTQCHQVQMTHLLQDDILRRVFSHHNTPIGVSHVCAMTHETAGVTTA